MSTHAIGYTPTPAGWAATTHCPRCKAALIVRGAVVWCRRVHACGWRTW